MLNLCRVTKVKVLFLVLVYVFNFNLFEFSAAILEKGLLRVITLTNQDRRKHRNKPIRTRGGVGRCKTPATN